MFQIRKFVAEKSKKQAQLCEKAKKVYEPNGLAGDLPPIWNCQRDGES